MSAQGMPMKAAKRVARRQARRRAVSLGLTVHRMREHRELPLMYFAASSRDEAVHLIVASYRPWPRLSARKRDATP